MKLKDLKKMNQSDNLSEQGWEKLANNLLNAKFDEERQQRIGKMLANEGIYRNEKAPQIIYLRKALAIAASFLIMIAVGWYLFSNDDNGALLLADQHLEQPFRLNEGENRGGDSVEINRGKALEAYSNQHFEKALEYLLEIEAQESPKASDYFQMGLCLMYQQEPNFIEAIKAFDKTRKMDTSIYNDEIDWFLSLCYLKINDKNKASNYLRKIMDSPSSRQQDAAKKLMEELIKSRNN